MTTKGGMTASCRCGSVEIEAFGRPILSAVCYCFDCQTGAHQLEALANAGSVSEADGGTAYVLFRKDRISISKGSSLLKGHKIKPDSVTNRVVATCCDSAMLVNFDKGPFWVSVYRARLKGDLPPLQMRICTRSMPEGGVISDGVPGYSGYPFAMMMRLAMAGLAMFLRL